MTINGFDITVDDAGALSATVDVTTYVTPGRPGRDRRRDPGGARGDAGIQPRPRRAPRPGRDGDAMKKSNLKKPRDEATSVNRRSAAVLLENLYRDLRDRRLLLPLAASLVALVAVPMLIKQGGEAGGPPPPASRLDLGRGDRGRGRSSSPSTAGSATTSSGSRT